LNSAEHQGGFKKNSGSDANFERAKDLLEEKRSRRQHLQSDSQACSHRHAVRRRNTMIFSIIMALTAGIPDVNKLSAAALTCSIDLRRAIIYWFTGASMQAVTTGLCAVEFIKANIKT